VVAFRLSRLAPTAHRRHWDQGRTHVHAPALLDLPQIDHLVERCRPYGDVEEPGQDRGIPAEDPRDRVQAEEADEAQVDPADDEQGRCTNIECSHEQSAFRGETFISFTRKLLPPRADLCQ
jgi:hypothetical protein